MKRVALEGKSWMESRLIEGFVFVPVTSHSEKASLGTAAVSVTKFQSSFLIFTFFRSYFGQTNGNRDTLAWNFIYIYMYISWVVLDRIYFVRVFFFSVIEKNFGARCDLFHHFVGTRREIDNYLATEVARFVKKAVVKMVASETVKGERERKKKRGRCMLVASCREFDAFLLPERRSVGTRRFPSVKFT